MSDNMKTIFDWVATGVTFAAFVSWLPHIAAGLGVVWGFYRIYETHLNVKLLKKQLSKE